MTLTWLIQLRWWLTQLPWWLIQLPLCDHSRTMSRSGAYIAPSGLPKDRQYVDAGSAL